MTPVNVELTAVANSASVTGQARSASVAGGPWDGTVMAWTGRVPGGVRRGWDDEGRGDHTGTVKLSSKGMEKRRSSLELQTYAAALAPVISAQIANACARTARYSAAGR